MTGSLAAIQFDPWVGALSRNRERIYQYWKKSTSLGAELVVFPEMALTGYPLGDLARHEAMLEAVEAHMQALAETTREGASLLVGAPRIWKGRLYNAVWFLRAGAIERIFSKRFLPNQGVFDEPRLFSSGKASKPVPIAGHNFGILVCEDMWNKSPAKQLHKDGADVLLVINGSPYESGKFALRLSVARQRVEETGMPILYLNLVGGQDELVFDGMSFALDASGGLCFCAPAFEESLSMLILENGKWRATGQHTTNAPALPRQQDDQCALDYRALMAGLTSYVEKTGFRKVFLGLSGGIDSALTASIAADALGKEAVRLIGMPSEYTSAASIADAEALAGNLGITMETIPIDALVACVRSALAPNAPEGVALENIQSRLRGILLMARANQENGLLLTTGNKSELACGYTTLYGDSCGGFSVLKDVYKTHVYRLARWRNGHIPNQSLCRTVQSPIPEHIFLRAPSAELRPNQKDTDSLPEYDTLDSLLALMIEQDTKPAELIARGFSEEMVKKIWTLVCRSEHKRIQSPLGVKLSLRDFYKDRRYPCVNHFQETELPL